MILAIESSCDDSSIALLGIESGGLLFHRKMSQEKEHTKYGGVVPELASRLHALYLPMILEQARGYLSRIKAIAVTNEPGLSVTLNDGVMMAKALSISLHIPIIEVNHLVGHIYSLFIEKETILPLSVLLVSGGHTMILEAFSIDDIRVVASTMDDSFGESFDKCAKLLNLGYPGGPAIERVAKGGDEDRFAFTLPLKGRRVAFSYSGIKNAFRLELEKIGEPTAKDKADLCASFQKVAIEHLLDKVEQYFEVESSGIEYFGIVGGASANLKLRENMTELCKKYGKRALFAELEYCSDNAAMIARAGLELYKKGRFTDAKSVDISPKNRVLKFLN